ncbi:hypothetical protein [Sphingomonas yabuuchiae]|uniref:Uncharacterized protein n=1 Tax=Sphingomonas yabuuchiae TaxID=172044 RepID=A0AA40ZXE6_9SPHN|nr:hypothetical protein [Sphingomonas yabuuchiae]MBB4611648.1 hypothetical protein [Sphingomonas yabuuchiae]MBN3556764.1 hypothetical protein [Sphingomonas yabuuchiae]
MTVPTVVAKAEPISKPRLHAKIMRGWARAIDRMGKGAFLDAIECSTQALDKQLAGSMPSLETLDRALTAEPTVLDDWLAARGKRLVDQDATCDVDDMGLLMARVLVMIQEAEHPEGPGGRTIVPQEYLNGEKIMRELHAVTGRWIEKCSDLRRPREVA